MTRRRRVRGEQAGMSDATDDLARIVSELVRGKTELDPALAEQVAAAIASNFKVRPEEVAILRTAGNGTRLEFIFPEKLAKVGSIPMTNTSALAVRTVRGQRSLFMNRFATAPHPIAFEAVHLGPKSSQPVRKIMSVPVVAQGRAVGVIQVSRRGPTVASGPDFGPKDVEELNHVATVLGSCFSPG